ncbi:unnamed protein product [Orchesella dallaii]|uniref:Gustatory receptor n=1 Tax=Orchesella dallaii TaxID=48710 RepID=A0ABP1QCK2_9HEXA
MGSPLQWFVFKIPYQLYDSILPFPFKWNSTTMRLLPNISMCGANKKLTAWLWSGPLLFGLNLALYIIHVHILSNLEPERRFGLAYYVRLLLAILNLFTFGTIIQFAMYYTKNMEDMAALFTGTSSAFEGAVDKLGAWYLITTKPFYKDFLGVALAGATFILGFLAVSIPVIGVLFEFDALAPFFPTNFSNINNTFDAVSMLLRILVRLLFYFFPIALKARWFNFVLAHLAIVLETGNRLLILLRNYLFFPPPPYRDPLRRKQSGWEGLLIGAVLIHRQVFLHTQFWSHNIGHLIFMIYSLGIMIWCVSNFTVISLGYQFGFELNAMFISLSLLCMIMFVILVSFVSNMAINSKKWTTDIARMLCVFKSRADVPAADGNYTIGQRINIYNIFNYAASPKPFPLIVSAINVNQVAKNAMAKYYQFVGGVLQLKLHHLEIILYFTELLTTSIFTDLNLRLR